MSTIVKERSNVLNVEVSRRNDRNVDRRNGSELELHRGMIVFASINNDGNGSVQTGDRPILICSNERNNKYSPNISCVVLTSKMSKKPLPTHVLLTTDEVPCLKVNSVALCEQLMTVSKENIKYIIGTVSDEIMQKINKAMMIQLGLM